MQVVSATYSKSANIMQVGPCLIFTDLMQLDEANRKTGIKSVAFWLCTPYTPLQVALEMNAIAFIFHKVVRWQRITIGKKNLQTKTLFDCNSFT